MFFFKIVKSPQIILNEKRPPQVNCETASELFWII
jgi:hypothetical protein